MTTRVGLRIDVDTFRGMRDGVPALLKLLEAYGIRATFFMSVGPDNMGRHLWRLLKPRFLHKMLRSRAASLYGYDILLRGTCWPGPVIGRHFPHVIRAAQQAGHEVGLHAWDHYSWQTHIDRFSAADMQRHLQRGFDLLSDILGDMPRCSAAAGWRCNEKALLMKEPFAFAYNSDCRGTSLFQPLVDGKKLAPQVPVTLPTYDEIIGTHGLTDAGYNEALLGQCRAQQLNVYTIHAEVEGMAKLALFEQMLRLARERDIVFVTLGECLASAALPAHGWVRRDMPGREGWLAVQGQMVS
jgi:undecaprenyl phosphate-alpha-L-ara4FN deformylase